MIEVEQLFEVKYGINLELNALQKSPNGINFVSRTSRNNGVSARVTLIPNIEPLPAGTITVAGGGSVMESFLQPEPYYSGRDLYYLTAKQELTDAQKLYYCACLCSNKYRYSYGRQANKTLRSILIPELSEIPKWVDNFKLDDLETKSRAIVETAPTELDTSEWVDFYYEDLFEIERGRGPRRSDLISDVGTVPFITSIDSKNGLSGYTTMPPCHSGNTIGVNRNGSVGEAFYQYKPFCSTEDVHILKPKFALNVFRAMFLIALIRKEKYRFNYGRKWGIERMKKSRLKLPVTLNGSPDWDYMESYIKTMPFSTQL